jgi:DNA replication protein DnaC
MLRSLAIHPGSGKTLLATGLAIRACQAGHRALFAAASQWVDRLAVTHHAGRLQANWRGSDVTH